jgi:hypothetical protein
VRYLPLTLAAIGAILIWLGPQPHRVPGGRLGDDATVPGIGAGELVLGDRRGFSAHAPRVGATGDWIAIVSVGPIRGHQPSGRLTGVVIGVVHAPARPDRPRPAPR